MVIVLVHLFEILQLQDFRVNQIKEPCIRFNTRELDRVLSTN